MKHNFLTILTASALGLIFNYLHIPAGAMVGAMLGTAILQLNMRSKLKIPVNAKRIIRVMMGTFIGLGIGIENIAQLKLLLLPAIISLVSITFVTLASTIILINVFKLNKSEAFLSCIPAGLAELSMNSEELNADTVIVTTLQIFRLVGILTLIPLLLKFLS